MTWEHRHSREGRAFSGAILVVIGTLLLLGNLNVLEIRPLLTQWWPLILVIIGVKHLLIWRGPSAWAGSLLWIGTGALFLASTMGYIQIAITSVIWPLMLIWFGVVIVFGCSNQTGRSSIREGSDM